MSARKLAAAIGCAVLLGLSVPLWPSALGGSMSYVVPRGVSMEPGLSDGDLAVVREQSAYRVGDIAAYRNTALERVVVHRIVAVNGGVYTFRGDANTFQDPQGVRHDQIVGRLSASVPWIGGLLLWLTSPVNALLLLALGTLIWRDRARLRSDLRLAPAPVAVAMPAAAAATAATALRQQLLDDERVLPIRDMSFPHELAVAELVRPESLLHLADRYDRPVLHDESSGVLFVVEPSMLYRCVLEEPAVAAAPLAVVRALTPAAASSAPAPASASVAAAAVSAAAEPPAAPPERRPATRTVTPAQDRPARHNWPQARGVPTPQGRDWHYGPEPVHAPALRPAR
jgi:signal peptidase I